MADTEQKAEQITAEEKPSEETQKNGEATPSADGDRVSEEVKADEKVTEADPALEQKIIRQVEYYFGDANLGRDKFLNEEMKKDDGWVTLTTLLTFNRLKQLSEDPSLICAALRKSTDDLVEVKADDSAIRRNPARALPTEEEKKTLPQRHLYVKGFPVELTLDDLVEYFSSHGVVSVNMRYDAKRKFKGSVFVIFKTVEQAEAFLKAPEMKYKDTPLVERLLRQDYFTKKQEEKLGYKQEEVKKKEEQKLKKEQEEKEELLNRMTKGAILKVSGLPAETEMPKIKEFFGKFGKVAWVDFDKGDEFALVRYGGENEAKTAWEKAESEGGEEKTVKLGDAKLTASVMEGDEEEAHWKKVFESINKRFSHGGGGRGRGKPYRGGHGNKRKGGSHWDQVSEKRSKNE